MAVTTQAICIANINAINTTLGTLYQRLHKIQGVRDRTRTLADKATLEKSLNYWETKLAMLQGRHTTAVMRTRDPG